MGATEAFIDADTWSALAMRDPILPTISGYVEALLVNRARGAREHFNVPVAPDPEIIRTDAALGQNGGRLRENKSGPADRATAEMNQVPIVRVAVLTGILTHR